MQISEDGKNLACSPQNSDPYLALTRGRRGQLDRDEVDGPLQIVQREMERSLKGEEVAKQRRTAPPSGKNHNPSFIPPRNFKIFGGRDSGDISNYLRRLALKEGDSQNEYERYRRREEAEGLEWQVRPMLEARVFRTCSNSAGKKC